MVAKPTTAATALRGKHVGSQRVDICRPALMRSRCDRDQKNCQPCIFGDAQQIMMGVTANAQTSSAVLRLAFKRPSSFQKRTMKAILRAMLPTLAPL